MSAPRIANHAVEQLIPAMGRGDSLESVRMTVRAVGGGEENMPGEEQGDRHELAAAALGQALEVVELGGWTLFEHQCANTRIDVTKVEAVQFESLGIELQWGVGYLDENQQLKAEEPWYADRGEAEAQLDELNASCLKCNLGIRYELVYQFVSQPQWVQVEARR